LCFVSVCNYCLEQAITKKLLENYQPEDEKPENVKKDTQLNTKKRDKKNNLANQNQIKQGLSETLQELSEQPLSRETKNKLELISSCIARCKVAKRNLFNEDDFY